MKKVLLVILISSALLLFGCASPEPKVIPYPGEGAPPPPPGYTYDLPPVPAPTPAPAPAPPPPAPAPTPTPEPEKPPPQQIEPQVIKEWSGTGIKTTEPFTIKEQPWVIAWEHEPVIMEGQSMGILQIMVYETKNPDIPITIAANSMEKGSDTSYIYETGEFYLTINAANTNWSVKVLAN